MTTTFLVVKDCLLILWALIKGKMVMTAQWVAIRLDVILLSCSYIMVNVIKGQFISCDIPMAQFIINMNKSLPTSQKFIIHVLDNTHLFVQPHATEMIRSAIAEFRDQNSYEKPA
ncbi:hypothetical protein CsSME_00044849 [Camellia sinensis var. sinensis]